MLRFAIACSLAVSLAAASFAATPLAAQEKSEAEKFGAFVAMMKNVKLKGSYTVVGKKAGELAEEEYVIKSVKKLNEGDYWLFDAQIRYDGKDMPLQIPIEVKWAGDTPVITLENFTIPSLGTFSARIVLYRDAYAGMWIHGETKGHLFGVIEKVADDAKEEDKKEEDKKEEDKKEEDAPK